MLRTRETQDRLSTVERILLEFSATGAVLAEVAGALGMSQAEARAHLACARRALGARSKLEAVLLALRRDLIRLPADGTMAGGREARRG